MRYRTNGKERLVFLASRDRVGKWIREEDYDSWDYIPVHIKKYEFSSKAVSSTITLIADDGRTYDYVFAKASADFIQSHEKRRFLLGRGWKGVPLLVLDAAYPKSLSPIPPIPHIDRKPDAMQEILAELRAIRKLLEDRT